MIFSFCLIITLFVVTGFSIRFFHSANKWKSKYEFSQKGKHPVQRLHKEKDGAIRFVKNDIVEFLLDNGGYDMNKLAMLAFDESDRQQFAQLIGYSLHGFSELSYVDDEVYERSSVQLEEIG